MSENDLLERVAQLGLPMMAVSAEPDAAKTLADVVKSRDTRLWEGFPVLLANAARNYQFEYDRVAEFLSETSEQRDSRTLLLLSLALYEANKLTFNWAKQAKAKLSDQEKKQFVTLKGYLSGQSGFDFGGTQFDPERLKNMFMLYFKEDAGKSKDRQKRYEELALEYALSQLFSPKQKELFRKKLDGVPLSKTEKEYFSRAVKKKVLALANAELHRMAQQLMEY